MFCEGLVGMVGGVQKFLSKSNFVGGHNLVPDKKDTSNLGTYLIRLKSAERSPI